MPSLFVVIPSLPALAGTARDLLFAYSPAAVGAAYGFHLSSRLEHPGFSPCSRSGGTSATAEQTRPPEMATAPMGILLPD